MSNLKEVMTLDQFGLCPKCGRLMGMLEANYTMYLITPHGHYPSRILDQDNKINYACICGYRCEMVRTSHGIFPKNHVKVQEGFKEDWNGYEEPANPALKIGYIEEE